MVRYKITDFTNITCCICGRGDLTSNNVLSGGCICEEFITKWLCKPCYFKYKRNLPDSYNNTVKNMAKCRNRQQTIDSNFGKGLIGEQIWCKWRGKGAKNCNIEKNNFDSKEDVIDSKYGIVQIKLATLIYGKWHIRFGHHDFNTAGILFVDKDMKNVEMFCIIPREELYGIYDMYITKDYKIARFDRHLEICEKFRVDNDTLYNINNIYQDLMKFLKDKKFFDIEDIKKWTETG